MAGKATIALMALAGWSGAAAAQSPEPAASAAPDARKCLIAQRAYKPLDPTAVAVVAVPCGSVRTRTSSALPPQQVERYLAGFADCVVAQKTFRAKVVQFLRSVPGSGTFGPLGLAATDMTCLNDAARRSGAMLTMRMKPAAYREALYPALYRLEFRKRGPVAAIAAAAPLSLSAEFDGSIDTLPPDYRPRRALGDCVSRAQPGSAHALLLAKPRSPDEGAAVALLKPALGSCLSEGLTIRLSRGDLRAYIGEALYKLSRAADPAAGLQPDRGAGDARH